MQGTEARAWCIRAPNINVKRDLRNFLSQLVQSYRFKDGRTHTETKCRLAQPCCGYTHWQGPAQQARGCCATGPRGEQKAELIHRKLRHAIITYSSTSLLAAGIACSGKKQIGKTQCTTPSHGRISCALLYPRGRAAHSSSQSARAYVRHMAHNSTQLLTRAAELCAAEMPKRN